MPLHPPPLQPEKVELLAGLAVKVTCVPGAKLVLQVIGQLIPAGELATLPPPHTRCSTAAANCCRAGYVRVMTLPAR